MITAEDWHAAIANLRERVPAPSDVPEWAEANGLDVEGLTGIASSIAALTADAMDLANVDEESGEVEVDPENLPTMFAIAETVLQSLMVGYTVAQARVQDSDLPDPSNVTEPGAPENRGPSIGFGS